MLVERGVMAAGTLAAAGGYLFFCVRFRRAMTPLFQKLPGNAVRCLMVEQWVLDGLLPIRSLVFDGLVRLAIGWMHV